MAIQVATLIAGLAAAIYCWALGRAVRRLHLEKEGVAQAIARLDHAVSDCRMLFVQANALAMAREHSAPSPHDAGYGPSSLSGRS